MPSIIKALARIVTVEANAHTAGRETRCRWSLCPSERSRGTEQASHRWVKCALNEKKRIKCRCKTLGRFCTRQLFLKWSIVMLIDGKSTESSHKKIVNSIGMPPKSFFSHLLRKPRTYFCVHLMDGAARIFPNSYAATGNRTRVSRVAPDRDFWRTLNLLSYRGCSSQPVIWLELKNWSNICHFKPNQTRLSEATFSLS